MNPRPPERKSSGFDTLGSEDAPTGSGFEPLTSAVVVAAPDASFVTNERICFSQDSNSSEASRVKNRKRVISKKKEKNSTVQISSWSFFSLTLSLSFLSLVHTHTHSLPLSLLHTHTLSFSFASTWKRSNEKSIKRELTRIFLKILWASKAAFRVSSKG